MEQEKKNQNGAQELSVGDQIKVRREKLANLQAEGHNPFEITKFVQTTNSREIRENFDAMEGKPVSIAGRMMSKRGMGKVSFCDLQDKEGRIQLYASKVCALVCFRPTFSSTSSAIVWGLMEMRVAPPFLMTCSFSRSSVSGRPPSTVNSRQRERSKLSWIAVRSACICALESVVGVPPPMYNERM